MKTSSPLPLVRHRNPRLDGTPMNEQNRKSWDLPATGSHYFTENMQIWRSEFRGVQTSLHTHRKFSVSRILNSRWFFSLKMSLGGGGPTGYCCKGNHHSTPRAEDSGHRNTLLVYLVQRCFWAPKKWGTIQYQCGATALLWNACPSMTHSQSQKNSGHHVAGITAAFPKPSSPGWEGIIRMLQWYSQLSMQMCLCYPGNKGD